MSGRVIAEYEVRWPLGTKQRLVFDVYLYVGRGTKSKDYSGHGLRKASATIAAKSGATEAELNRHVRLDRTPDGPTLHHESRPPAIGRTRDGKVGPTVIRDALGETKLTHLMLEKERA